jgi:hypothetical protein
MPAGEVGEVILRAPQLMQGYWRNGEETSQTLRPFGHGPPWLFTRDPGYLDDSGYLYLVDRRKDLIRIGGMQVCYKVPARVQYVDSLPRTPPAGRAPTYPDRLQVRSGSGGCKRQPGLPRPNTTRPTPTATTMTPTSGEMKPRSSAEN